MGNGVGSVIANTCFVLATALVARPVRVERPALLPRALFAAGAGGMAYLLLRGGTLGRAEGFALFSLLVLYAGYNLWSRRAAAEEAAAAAATGR